MLPAMLPFALNFIDDKPDWLNWLPVTGHSLIMEDMFKGLPVDWNAMMLTTLVTIAATVALVVTLATKLKSEKVIQSLG